MAARHDARIWLALGTVYVVWGSTFIALAIVVRDLPPLLAMSARTSSPAACFSRSPPRRPRARPDRQTADRRRARLRRAALRRRPREPRLGAADRPGGVAALLVGTIPIWIVLLDRLFFGRRLQASAYVGLVLGFVGLGFLFDPFGEGQSTASARSSSCSAR